MNKKISIGSNELYIRSISYVANAKRYLEDEPVLSIHRNLDLFVYVVSGEADYVYDGVAHKAVAGDLVYLANGCDYCKYIKSDTYHFICAEFSFDAPENTLRSGVFRSIQDIDSCFKKLNKVWCAKETSFKSRCMSILYEIYSKLMWNEMSAYIPVQKRDVFKNIIKIVSENYTDKELSVEKLAKMANMSEVHFRKLFKNIYKVSPQQYIIHLRLERAKELLAFENVSVSYISDTLGFSDTCHFSRIFKQKIGYTPLEYRKIFNNF